jgi:hypothetical protein
MKRFRTLLVLALVGVPTVAVPALAATPATSGPVASGPVASGPVTVARYTFNGGVSGTGVIAENSGRGLPLTVRASGGATLRFGVRAPGRFVWFPARCAAKATSCARLILEGGDDPDLDPGTRPFRWGATLWAAPSQVGQSANVMQKGSSTGSQWKLQIGGTRPRAQCVVAGVTGGTYIARSDVTITDSRWHQVTCLRAGSTLAIFVDGRNRGHVAVPAALSIANANPLRVGGRGLTDTSDMYNGAIDDVYAQVA